MLSYLFQKQIRMFERDGNILNLKEKSQSRLRDINIFPIYTFCLSFSFFTCKIFALGSTVVSSALTSLATSQAPCFEADVQLY